VSEFDRWAELLRSRRASSSRTLPIIGRRGPGNPSNPGVQEEAVSGEDATSVDGAQPVPGASPAPPATPVLASASPLAPAPAPVPAGLQDAAQEAGAADIFVFRRVEERRFVHVGGVGRGEGWAGAVDLSLDGDAPSWAAEAVLVGSPVRVDQDGPIRVLGPYFAASALFVPVSSDLLVVFGHTTERLAELSDLEAMATATQAASGVDAVSPAKRLADELEVLHAVKDMMSFPAVDLEATAAHIVDCAARALSCDLGVLLVPGVTPMTAVVDRGDSGLDPQAVRSTMVELEEGLRPAMLPRCEQDAAPAPLPAPFRFEDGVRSYYLLEVGRPRVGLLLLAHTDRAPRGFTRLCQDLGVRLAEAADTLLRTVLSRSRLQAEIERVHRQARTDPLTGAANRLAWHEALSSAHGGTPAILVVDIDDLKGLNDDHGHDAGDEHLRAACRLLQDAAGPTAVVARLGGDEFGILLPDGARAEETVRRIDASVMRSPASGGLELSFAVGLATANPGEAISAVQRRADAAMYEAKRGRQVARAAPA